jgi:hypothetical protein
MTSVVIKNGAGRKNGWMREGRPEAAMFMRVDLIEHMMDTATNAVFFDTRTVESY